jgi:hypothetical protein
MKTREGTREIDMNESGLLDMYGLSGEPANDDRLDELFFRLESETSAPSNGISKSGASLPFIITIEDPLFESQKILLKFE